MELIDLHATVRTAARKGHNRRLRSDNRIPAVLYGPETEPVMLSVSIHELETVIRKNRGRQMMFNLIVQNGETKNRTAMLKEFQRHPVTRSYIHADFYEVSMSRKLRVRVPVVPVGKSIGVDMGGMVQVIRRELEVLCLPDRIPDQIEIDVTNMNIGETVHVEDLTAAEGVEYPHDVNFTVLTILGASKVKAGAETSEEEAAEGEKEETE